MSNVPRGVLKQPESEVGHNLLGAQTLFTLTAPGPGSSSGPDLVSHTLNWSCLSFTLTVKEGLQTVFNVNL